MVKSCIDVRIAVIMSTYNEEEQWLRASIESILSQSWDNLRFYILLDNPANGAHKRVVEASTSSYPVWKKVSLREWTQMMWLIQSA